MNKERLEKLQAQLKNAILIKKKKTFFICPAIILTIGLRSICWCYPLLRQGYGGQADPLLKGEGAKERM